MPPPPKPRGGLAALAGEEEETNQGQAFVSTCISIQARSRVPIPSLLPAEHVIAM
jgi:hypothetical protein